MCCLSICWSLKNSDCEVVCRFIVSATVFTFFGAFFVKEDDLEDALAKTGLLVGHKANGIIILITESLFIIRKMYN